MSNGIPSVSTSDELLKRPAQRTTICHVNPLHRNWARDVQITPEYVLIKRHKCPTIGVSISDLVALAVSQEPGLSWPPVFSQMPESVNIKNGTTAILSAAIAAGELPASLKWQSSTDGKSWEDISGQTGNSMTASVSGQYRCVATNAKGITATSPAIVTVQTSAATK